jgi:uncharacterized protein (DUF433 family)
MAIDIYGGRDPAELPLYSVRQAARYLHLSPTTLRSWVQGRAYPTTGGTGFFQPLLQRPSPSNPRLSFDNLIEAHVLRALRADHGVSMKAVRTALDYAQKAFGIDRLLLREELRATPGQVFLDRYGELINLSRAGQLALSKVLGSYLTRVDRDLRGLPARLFPFSSRHPGDAPKVIAIDPRISFGRPVIARRGISTAVLAERLDAGETVADLALDYDLAESEVEEAIVYERAA